MTKKSASIRLSSALIAVVAVIGLAATSASAQEDRGHSALSCTSSTGWQIKLSSTSKGVTVHTLSSPAKTWNKGTTVDYYTFHTNTAISKAGGARIWAYDYIQTGPNGNFLQAVGKLSASSAWCGT